MVCSRLRTNQCVQIRPPLDSQGIPSSAIAKNIDQLERRLQRLVFVPQSNYIRWTIALQAHQDPAI